MSTLRLPDARARLDVPSKECRVCQKPFFTTNSLTIVCGLRCAQRIPAFNRKAERAERKVDKAKLEALKTRSDWIKDAQHAFNAFIRARDAGKACICCGVPLGNQSVGGHYDCGHYRSIGSAPQLRFHPDNAHGQTKKCNRYGAGRAVDYRRGLMGRIGIAAVERLEADQLSPKWSIDDLRAIRDLYRRRLKELQ